MADSDAPTPAGPPAQPVGPRGTGNETGNPDSDNP